MLIESKIKTGLRATQKRERSLRIEAAARATFHEKGYAGATTAEIAVRAGVSIATLFSYAPEKRALLTMVFRADMRAVTDASFARPLATDVVEDLVATFEARYRVWLEDVPLARASVRESFGDLYAADSPTDLDDERTPPQYLLAARIAERIARHQACGNISSEIEAATIARLVMDVYLSEGRAWIVEASPQLEGGLACLRTMLRLALASLVAPREDVR